MYVSICVLSCTRGTAIGFIVAEKCFAMQKEGREPKNARETYKKAYQIAKLTKRLLIMKSLKKMYYKWYSEDVEL